jgi:hypothetical protein
MTDDIRIRDLLVEILGANQTPEDACSGCPELLPEVRERWNRLRRVRTQIDDLFPSSSTMAARLRDAESMDANWPQSMAMKSRGSWAVVVWESCLRPTTSDSID